MNRQDLEDWIQRTHDDLELLEKALAELLQKHNELTTDVRLVQAAHKSLMRLVGWLLTICGMLLAANVGMQIWVLSRLVELNKLLH